MIDYFDSDESDSIELAYKELKSADHLIYVTLKYTRTVDVIINILNKFISFFDYALTALLEKKLEEKKIDEIPKTPGMKIETLKNLYSNDPTILEYLDFYAFLRRLGRAEYNPEQEYRRHVKMSMKINNHILDLDIDKITEYYDYIKDFYKYLLKLVER